jgi:hypothetical protein
MSRSLWEGNRSFGDEEMLSGEVGRIAKVSSRKLLNEINNLQSPAKNRMLGSLQGQTSLKGLTIS